MPFPWGAGCLPAIADNFACQILAASPGKLVGLFQGLFLCIENAVFNLCVLFSVN